MISLAGLAYTCHILSLSLTHGRTLEYKLIGKEVALNQSRLELLYVEFVGSFDRSIPSFRRLFMTSFPYGNTKAQLFSSQQIQ